MPHYTTGARAKCPYYVREAKQSLSCEGQIEGTVGMIRFRSTAEKKRHILECCESDLYAAKCPVAAALETKYKGRRSCMTERGK